MSHNSTTLNNYLTSTMLSVFIFIISFNPHQILQSRYYYPHLTGELRPVKRFNKLLKVTD